MKQNYHIQLISLPKIDYMDIFDCNECVYDIDIDDFDTDFMRVLEESD